MDHSCIGNVRRVLVSLIMRDEPSLNKNITSTPLQYTYSTDLSYKIFVRILFLFNICYVVLIDWTFHYCVICKCVNTTVRDNGTVQFTFFLLMRLNITIVRSCDLLVVIIVPLFFHH